MTERRPWTVERLRLTAFLVTTVDITAWPERWDAFGVVPDQTTRNAKVGSLQQVGPLPWNASGRLLFQAEPLKLEWLTSYEGDGGLDTVTFPLFNTERTQFELHMERWLRHNPPSISRLAFGAILRVPVEDQKGAYDYLQEKLRIELPSMASDFFFRINVPMPSKVEPSLQINRISSWSAIRESTVLVRVSSISQEVQESSPNFAVRLELDINTSHEWASNVPQIDRVWHELNQMSEEFIS